MTQPANYCDEPCHGPVWPFSDLEIDLAKMAHWLFLHMPDWLAFSRVGFAILPWAGMHAFSCTCRDKNRAERARLIGETE